MIPLEVMTVCKTRIYLGLISCLLVLSSCQKQFENRTDRIHLKHPQSGSSTSPLMDEIAPRLGVLTADSTRLNTGTLHLFDLDGEPLPSYSPIPRVVSFQMNSRQIAYLSAESSEDASLTLYLLNTNGMPLPYFTPIPGVDSINLSQNRLTYITRPTHPNSAFDLHRGTLHILDQDGNPLTGASSIPNVCLDIPNPVQINAQSWIAYLSCEGEEGARMWNYVQLHVLNEQGSELTSFVPIIQDQSFRFKFTDQLLSYVDHPPQRNPRPTAVRTLIIRDQALTADPLLFREFRMNPFQLNATMDLLATLTPDVTEPMTGHLMIISGQGRQIHAPSFPVYLHPNQDSIMLAHQRMLYLSQFDAESDTATLHFLDAQGRELPSLSPIESIAAVIPTFNSTHLAYISAQISGGSYSRDRDLIDQMEYHIHLLDLEGRPVPSYTPRMIERVKQIQLSE